MNTLKKMMFLLFLCTLSAHIHPMTKLLAKAKAVVRTQLTARATQPLAQRILSRFHAKPSLSALPNLRRFITANPQKMAGWFGIFGGTALASCYKFTAQENHNKPFKQTGLLRIENCNGKVEVEGWDHDRLDISATKKASTQEELAEIKVNVEASLDKATIKTHVPQNRIIISSGNSAVIGTNGATISVVNGVSTVYVNGEVHKVNTGSYFSPAVDYAIKAPKGINLHVTQLSGETTVKGITGKVDVQSASGAITVDGAQTANARSSNGALEINNIRGTVIAKTDSGHINVSTVSDDVHANAASGSVSVSNVAQNVDAQTVSGSIDIAHVKGSVNAQATNGSISIRDIVARIWARATNGNIRVDQAQGTVDAQSTIGSVWINGRKQKGNWPF